MTMTTQALQAAARLIYCRTINRPDVAVAFPISPSASDSHILYDTRSSRVHKEVASSSSNLSLNRSNIEHSTPLTCLMEDFNGSSPYPEGVISFLDTDLYKLTMQCAVFKYFPQVPVTYAFKNRTPEKKLSRRAFKWLENQIKSDTPDSALCCTS
jgi:hypothetical protein